MKKSSLNPKNYWIINITAKRANPALLDKRKSWTSRLPSIKKWITKKWSLRLAESFIFLTVERKIYPHSDLCLQRCQTLYFNSFSFIWLPLVSNSFSLSAPARENKGRTGWSEQRWNTAWPDRSWTRWPEPVYLPDRKREFARRTRRSIPETWRRSSCRSRWNSRQSRT